MKIPVFILIIGLPLLAWQAERPTYLKKGQVSYDESLRLREVETAKRVKLINKRKNILKNMESEPNHRAERLDDGLRDMDKGIHFMEDLDLESILEGRGGLL